MKPKRTFATLALAAVMLFMFMLMFAGPGSAQTACGASNLQGGELVECITMATMPAIKALGNAAMKRERAGHGLAAMDAAHNSYSHNVTDGPVSLGFGYGSYMKQDAVSASLGMKVMNLTASVNAATDFDEERYGVGITYSFGGPPKAKE